MSGRISVGVAESAVCALMWGESLAQPSANQVQRVVANGVEFAYEGSGGTRDPVVFVHGGLQDYRMWELHRSAFAERYRVIAYSRRNHFPNAVSGDGTPDAPAHPGEPSLPVRARVEAARERQLTRDAGARIPVVTAC
jgi:non-heme chloroperoxidase